MENNSNQGRKPRPQGTSGGPLGPGQSKMPGAAGGAGGGTSRNYFMWGWLIIAAILVAFMFWNNDGKPAETDWNTVKSEMISRGEVAKIVVVNREVAEIYLTKDATERYAKQEKYKNIPTGSDQFQFMFTIGSVELFDAQLKEADEEFGQNISLDYRNDKGGWGSVLLNFLPWVILIGFWIFMMRNMSGMAGGPGGNIMGVGRAKAQVFDKEKQQKVTFKDVAGLEEAKVEIMEIVDFLKKPEKYKELGGKIPKGALLVGPPRRAFPFDFRLRLR